MSNEVGKYNLNACKLRYDECLCRILNTRVSRQFHELAIAEFSQVEVNNAPRTGFYKNNMSILKRTQKYALWYIRKFRQVTDKVVIDVLI